MHRDTLLRGFADERPRLLATLSRLVGPADAEDIANETWLRALDAVDDFRGEAALGTWLHRIAVNLAYDLLRQKNRQCAVEDPEAAIVQEAAIDRPVGEDLEQREMSACVRNLMTRLPPAQREVLAQADMYEQRVSELAENAGVTPGNAKIRLHRARRAMKVLLDNHCHIDAQDVGRLCCVPKKTPTGKP